MRSEVKPFQIEKSVCYIFYVDWSHLRTTSSSPFLRVLRIQKGLDCHCVFRGHVESTHFCHKPAVISA